MSEREMKLLVDADADLPPVTELLEGIGSATAEEVVDQEAAYFDTPDLRLDQAGPLRVRSSESGDR